MPAGHQIRTYSVELLPQTSQGLCLKRPDPHPRQTVLRGAPLAKQSWLGVPGVPTLGTSQHSAISPAALAAGCHLGRGGNRGAAGELPPQGAHRATPVLPIGGSYPIPPSPPSTYPSLAPLPDVQNKGQLCSKIESLLIEQNWGRLGKGGGRGEEREWETGGQLQ